ncbi:Peptidase C78 [Babesia duncani]|uniref:Peptidase C78 n=1 Tax=Babesia duncani TaxID=323732 RepID=A0AAD9UNS9_9APIC|nr:Peptidase C78 [Babesia duncani]
MCRIYKMTIAISFDIVRHLSLKCIQYPEEMLFTHLLRMEHPGLDYTWICSFRHAPKDSSMQTLDTCAFPYFLKPCGIAIGNVPLDFKINNIEIPEHLKTLDEFYVLLYNSCSLEISCMHECLSCSIAKFTNGKLHCTAIAGDAILWVDNDNDEMLKNNMQIWGCTLLVNVPMKQHENVDMNESILGISTVDKVNQKLKISIQDTLEEVCFCSGAFDVAANLQISSRVYTNTPNTDSGAFHKMGIDRIIKKHVLLSHQEMPETLVMFQLVLQNLVLIKDEIAQMVNEEITNEAKEHVLRALHYQATSALDYIKQYSTTSCVMASILPPPKTNDVVVARDKSKSSKPGSRAKTKSNVRNKPKVVNAQDGIENVTEPTRISLDSNSTPLACILKLNKQTGKLELQCNAPIKPVSTIERVQVTFCIKIVTDDSNGKIPFGGIALPLFDLLTPNTRIIDSIVPTLLPGKGREFLVNAMELADANLLASPHLKGKLMPSWMSPKKSRATLVNGPYLYYHYNTCGISDGGWGCCYRSLETVCSWYMLNYYTTRAVPTHWEIQALLKEKDPSHSSLEIGSNKWIGTVESGYFINWYLGFQTRTLYLNEIADFRNYNCILAEHFSKIKTPVIMGVGLYAYVLLGICLGTEPGDAAYLIADPHYTGEHNIKSILEKGAVGWKRIDFLSKAAQGSFINICCPLLETT